MMELLWEEISGENTYFEMGLSHLQNTKIHTISPYLIDGENISIDSCLIRITQIIQNTSENIGVKNTTQISQIRTCSTDLSCTAYQKKYIQITNVDQHRESPYGNNVVSKKVVLMRKPRNNSTSEYSFSVIESTHLTRSDGSLWFIKKDTQRITFHF